MRWEQSGVLLFIPMKRLPHLPHQLRAAYFAVVADITVKLLAPQVVTVGALLWSKHYVGALQATAWSWAQSVERTPCHFLKTMLSQKMISHQRDIFTIQLQLTTAQFFSSFLFLKVERVTFLCPWKKDSIMWLNLGCLPFLMQPLLIV